MIKVPLSDILKGNHKELNHMSEKSVERILELVQQPVTKQALTKGGMIAGGVARKIILAALGIQDFPDYSLENRPPLEKKDIITLEKLKRLPYLRISLNEREKCCHSIREDVKNYSSLFDREYSYYNKNVYDMSLKVLSERFSAILCSRGHYGFDLKEVEKSNFINNLYDYHLSKVQRDNSIQAEDIDIFFRKEEDIVISDYLSYVDDYGKQLFNSPFSWNFFLSKHREPLDPNGYDEIINNIIFLNKEFCGIRQLRSGYFSTSEIENGFDDVDISKYYQGKNKRPFSVKTIGAQSSLLKEPLLVQLVWNQENGTYQEILDSFDSESLKAGFFLEGDVIYFMFSKECIKENKNRVLKFNNINNLNINNTFKRLEKYSRKTKIDINGIKAQLNHDILYSQFAYFHGILKNLKDRLDENSSLPQDKISNSISAKLNLDKVKSFNSNYYMNFFMFEEFLQSSSSNFHEEIFYHFSENYEKAKKANFKIIQLFEFYKSTKGNYKNTDTLFSLNKDFYNFLLFENGASFLVEKISQGINAETLEDFYKFIDELEEIFPFSELCDLYLKDTRIVSTIRERHLL